MVILVYNRLQRRNSILGHLAVWSGRHTTVE